MRGRLQQKRIIITGAATGIGKEAAGLFVAEGARVAIADINEKDGAATASELGDAVSFFGCDLSSEKSVHDLVAAATRWLGGLDVLVNNAGVQYSGRITEFDSAHWDALMTVNVRAHFYAVKYAVPHLRQAGGGSIINISSLAGLRGGPGMTAYSASKGAVIAFTTALAMELAPDKIRVNAICPGWVDTPFNQPAISFLGGREAQEQLIRLLVPLGRQATPAEIAPLFVYLASDESAFMTAQAIIIDGGVYN